MSLAQQFIPLEAANENLISAVLTGSTKHNIRDFKARNAISGIISAVDQKIMFDDHISGISGYDDLAVVKLSADEYAQMLEDGTCLSNAIYIVEAPTLNAFKQRIINVAPGTGLSDAVNLQQLQSVSAGLTGDYYKKTETSSSTQIANALTSYYTKSQTSSSTQIGNALTSYYTKSQTSSASEISTALSTKSTVSFSRITTSGTNIGSITIDGTTTQIYAPAGGGGASRYALETAQLVADSGSLTCAVNDQAITTIQVSSSSTPVVVQLPAQPADGGRDFILRIEISSSAAPTFTFNGAGETIDFDSEDDDWAVMEPGLNLVSFTETKRSTSN